MRIAILALSLVLLTLSSGWAEEKDEATNWPQWRGPNANGLASDGNPPIQWGEDRNVSWKTPLPGKGSSTPVVWDNVIYLTAAVPTGKTVEPEPEPPSEPPAGGQRRRRGPRGIQPSEHRLLVMALDRSSGKTLWETTVKTSLPHEGTHNFGNYASGSPVTDGDRIWASFGSQGIFCLDKGGKILWETDLGDMNVRLSFGEGSSPVLHGDKLVIQWDHEGDSFVTALDKNTGKQVWKTPRDEMSSWSSPLVVEHGGQAQVITNATTKIRSYRLDNGELIWESEGMTVNTIPAPIARDGVVYLMSGYRGSSAMAIDLSKAKGDITGSDAILWKLDRDTPYTPSPLLYGDQLYFLKVNTNVLTVVDPDNGEMRYQERLAMIGDVFSSPVGAAERVYITDREGKTLVLKNGPTLEVLATNELNDGFDASMVVVGDEIFLRSNQHLYKIAEE